MIAGKLLVCLSSQITMQMLYDCFLFIIILELADILIFVIESDLLP